MFRICRVLLCLLSLISLFYAPNASGQVAYYGLSRYTWLTQAQNIATPVSYQFQATVSGLNLGWVTLQSPAITISPSGDNAVLNYSTNYSPVLTNLAAGPTNLNANFPVGNYLLAAQTISTNNANGRVTIRTNTFNIAFTNDFSYPPPILISPQPPASLTSTQNIVWPAYPAPAGSYTALYVLEGSFDSAFIGSLINGGLSALTNFSWKVSCPNLPITQTNYVATNLDSTMDHIVWLEYNVASPQAQLPLNNVASLTINLSLFPGKLLPTQPVLSANLLATNLIQITVLGPPRVVYSVQACAALSSNVWQTIGGITLDGTGAGSFTDSTQTYRARYYRLTGQQ